MAAMAAVVGCPVCNGPVVLDEAPAEPACRVGHQFSPDALTEDLTERASRALWAAITALGDEVTSVRCCAAHTPQSRERLLEQAAQIQEQVDLLHSLLPKRTR